VMDAAATARRQADVLIGERPEANTRDAPRSMPDVGGSVGTALIEMGSLEEALDELQRQTARLNALVG
jgi:hypothetical protein